MKQGHHLSVEILLILGILFIVNNIGICGEKVSSEEIISVKRRQLVNDLNLLPQSLRKKIQIITKQYEVPKEEILKIREIEKKETIGDSEILYAVRHDYEGNEKFIFFEKKVKSVCYRDKADNGYDISYYANSYINSFVEYQKGTLHGAFMKFHKNGKLQLFATCQNGKFVGVAKRWDDSGKIIEETNFKEPHDFIINKNPLSNTSTDNK